MSERHGHPVLCTIHPTEDGKCNTRSSSMKKLWMAPTVLVLAAGLTVAQTSAGGGAGTGVGATSSNQTSSQGTSSSPGTMGTQSTGTSQGNSPVTPGSQ